MKSLRLVSALLVLGAAACSSDRITGTDVRTPGRAAADGGGYIGGVGRTTVLPASRPGKLGARP